MPKRSSKPRKEAPERPPDQPTLVFPDDYLWDVEQAESDAEALLSLFYFRRVLDHGALGLLYRGIKPLSQFFSLTEKEIKSFFAHHEHLRGYVDAHQLVSNSQHRAAVRYAERQNELMSGHLSGVLLTDGHPNFPRRLRRSRLPVQWLFFHPFVPARLSRPVVAIVGSRDSTKAQLAAAAEVAERVGAVRGTVVTGLATGADAAAHVAARDTEASLIAVMGSGLAKPYPANHARWVKELLDGRGTILTEVPTDYPPNADAFVLRNRIVASLADVVIAVSGKYASGTSHTVRFAADAGVPLVSVDSAPNSGISKLVRELGGNILSPADLSHQLFPEED